MTVIKKKVIYLCDRKECGDRCSYPTCRHTADASHAVNPPEEREFEVKRVGDREYYVEVENGSDIYDL